MFCSSCGFNILVYGFGSKRPLLEEFRTTMLKGFSQLVVNGYFPSLSVKHVHLLFWASIVSLAVVHYSRVTIIKCLLTVMTVWPPHFCWLDFKRFDNEIFMFSLLCSASNENPLIVIQNHWINVDQCKVECFNWVPLSNCLYKIKSLIYMYFGWIILANYWLQYAKCSKTVYVLFKF